MGTLRVVLAMLTVVFFLIGALMVVFSGLAGEPIENLNTAVRGDRVLGDGHLYKPHRPHRGSVAKMHRHGDA